MSIEKEMAFEVSVFLIPTWSVTSLAQLCLAFGEFKA